MQKTKIEEKLEVIKNDITRIAIFRNFVTSPLDNLASRIEVGRVTPINTRFGAVLRITFEIPDNIAICPIAAIVAATSTTVTLDDAANFNSFDERVGFEDTQETDKRTISKVGNILTFDTPFSIDPVNLIGKIAQAKNSCIGLISGGGNDTPLSGDLFDAYQKIWFKDGTDNDLEENKTGRITINYRGT